MGGCELIIAGLLFLVVAGCSSGVVETEVGVYNPWDIATLRPGLDVASQQDGECFAPAASVDRPDAWRCAAGSSLHDPCFIGGEPAMAVCVESPWDTKVTMLEVTMLELANAPAQQERGGDTVWALELEGGERCLMISGATSTAAGERLNYQCDSGVIYGDPDTDSEVWTVHYQAEGALAQTARDVVVAWR